MVSATILLPLAHCYQRHRVWKQVDVAMKIEAPDE